MRILVVGGSGYIGSRPVPLLSAGGHDLVLTTREPRSLAARFPGAGVVAADLLEPDSLEPATADRRDRRYPIGRRRLRAATARLEYGPPERE